MQKNNSKDKKLTTTSKFLFLIILFLILIGVLVICVKNSSELTNNIRFEKNIRDKSNFANMIYPRYYHTATKLDDGNIIFICGGSKFSEIYDPKTKKFIKGSECKYNRYMHNTVKLPDGNLLIIGGHDETNPDIEIKDIELYDFKKQEFTVLTQLNNPLFCPKSVMLDDDTILVISSKISGNNTFSGLPEIINLKTKTSRVLENFPEDYCAYFEESMIPIKVDDNVIFYKLKMTSIGEENLLWDGENFKKIKGLDIFDKTWRILLPIENNKIFYTKSFSKKGNSFYQMGTLDLKTNENKTLLNLQRDREYRSFVPANIAEIANLNVIIAGGKTNTPKGKTTYSQDVYLYNKNKIQKIGLLYNKTLINFSISEIGNGKLLICGGRTEKNQNGLKKYKETNKCQIIKY